MKYSIILPAYNEEKIIEGTIMKVLDFMREFDKDFELIIANDGSIDSTTKIIGRISESMPELRMVSNIKNLGRGAALSNAFGRAKGEILIYIDADLAIDLELFPRLMAAIETEGADIAIGSKHIKGSQVEYPLLRRIASKGYAFLATLLLGSSVWDFQCGFKAFRREAIKKILPFVREKGWSWDTEVLVKAEWMGYKIKELPAKVVNVFERESKVHLLRDIRRMGGGLLALWLEKRNFTSSLAQR